MIGLEDRIVLAQDIDTAHRNGARLERACAEVGIPVCQHAFIHPPREIP